jgi:hypothetical protein
MRCSFVLILPMLMAGVLPVSAQSSSSLNTYVFPLFADGTGGGTSYRSVLKITKTGTTNPLQCTLTQRNTSAPFIGVDGTFYYADVFDGGFSPLALTQITLDQFLPFEILRTNAQSPLNTGYAKLSCGGTVEAQLQVSLSDKDNKKLGEATMTPAMAGTSFQFLIDRRDGTRLAVSLVNDSATFVQFAIIARDRFNFEVDRVYETIEPRSQLWRFVDQMLTLPADFVGSIQLVSLSAGQNYAVGVQFSGSVFTTVQPLVGATQ